MSQDFQYVADILVSTGVDILRQNAVAPRLVNTDKQREAAQKNQYITVPVPSPVAAQDITAGSAMTRIELAPSGVQVKLDQWKGASFQMSDKEMAEVVESRVVPMEAGEAIKSIANAVDAFVIGKLRKRAFGVQDTSSGTAVADITAVRKILNLQLCPVDNRRLLVDPIVEAEMLNLDAFRDVDKTGQSGALLEGSLGRRLGFDIFMDQNIVNAAIGSATNTYLANAQFAIGDLSGVVKTGSGTVLEGDIITFAGSTLTYVVTSGVTAAGQTLAWYPACRTTVASGDAITIKATRTNSLAFHRDAMVFASRPLTVNVTPGVIISQDQDPISGISLRCEVKRINKMTIWEFDCLYGGEVVRPELICRLADA